MIGCLVNHVTADAIHPTLNLSLIGTLSAILERSPSPNLVEGPSVSSIARRQMPFHVASEK